jgi:hypothetical protein
MRRIYFAIGILATLGVLALVYSLEQTTISNRIESNPALKAAALNELRVLNEQGKLTGWYCSSVTTTPRPALKVIAPDCEFARLYFHQRHWDRIFQTLTRSRFHLDVALRKSDGKHRLVLQRFEDREAFPEFLVWAKCKIDTPELARMSLVAAFNSTDFGPITAEGFVACRESENVWRISLEEIGCEYPMLVLETDDQGVVTGGRYDANPPRKK